MLYLLQVYKLCDDRELFIDVFNDLSFELEEQGYKDCPEDLIETILVNHFNIVLGDPKQLKELTNTIIEKQGNLKKEVLDYFVGA